MRNEKSLTEPMSSQQLVALVDYHNVRSRQDSTEVDCAVNLEMIVDCVVDLAAQRYPSVDEVSLRLYGGWVDESGVLTRCADWILRFLPEFRGLSRRIRVLPELVVSAVCLPQEQLRGTIRMLANRQRQKMVDSLMTLDAVAFGQGDFDCVLLLSDDDDLVPAALGSAILGAADTCLARFESSVPRPNDPLLMALGIQLLSLPRTRRRDG